MHYLVIISILIQFISIAIAIRQIRSSNWKRLWAGITASVFLYILHEAFPLSIQVFLNKNFDQPFFAVLIDLAISTFILFAVIKLSAYLDTLENEEKMLQESLALKNLIIDQVPSVIWTMDKNLLFTSSRGSGLVKLGLKPDQVLGMSVFKYFGSEDTSRHEIAVHINALKGESGNFEMPIGTGIWVAKVDPLRDKSGEITGIIGLAVDVSEIEKSKENLRASEEKFKNIIDSVPNGMHFYTLESDGTLRLTGANPSADKMLNVAHAPIIGKRIEEAFPNLTGTFIPGMYAQVASGELGHQLFEIPYTDEKICGFYEVHVFRTNPNAIAVVFVDISERKNTEIELEKYRVHLEQLVTERTSQLEEAMKAAEQATKIKSEFMANMSHEIRTPMNAIIGLTNSALKTNLDAKQKDYLEKIEKSSISLLRIINDILDFSKIEAGMLKLEQVEFVFENILENIRNVISDKAIKKGLDFLFRIDPEVPHILTGDPLRLEQILINLCGNAVKFTEKGEIIISADVIEKTDTKVKIGFSVKDTGIGIREEDKEKLFEKFSQTDASITRKFGGTGLGLSITKDLLNLMGGEISVDSRPGLGSTFTFVLEFGYEASAGTHSQSGSKNSNDLSELYARLESIRSAHILLVEDDEINQQVASELLESAGMLVETASNGVIAVEKLKQTAENEQPDLVLMDLHMPEMDGYTATAKIREIERFSGLPVFAMTADVVAGVKEKCLETGMQGFLSKPINPKDLFETLLEWIPASVGKGSAAHRTRESNPGLKIPVIAGLKTEAGLKNINNNRELYLKLLDKFYENYSSFTERVSGLITSNDISQSVLLVHTLKGVAANLGASEIEKRAGQLEEVLKSNNSLENMHLVSELDEVLSKTLKSLNSELAANNPISFRPNVLSVEEALKLLEEIELLIKDKNPDINSRIEELCLPSEFSSDINLLKKQLLRYKFKDALSIVLGLKKTLQNRTEK